MGDVRFRALVLAFHMDESEALLLAYVRFSLGFGEAPDTHGI